MAFARERHRTGDAGGCECGVEPGRELELVFGALPLAAQREKVAQGKTQAGVLWAGADLPLYPFGVLGHGAFAQHCKPIAHEASSLTDWHTPRRAGVQRTAARAVGKTSRPARGPAAHRGKKEIRLPCFP
jgi:hypothetical protein